MLVLFLVLTITLMAFASERVCCIQTLVDDAGQTTGAACISNFPIATCPPGGAANAFGDPKHKNCCKTKLATCTQFFTYVDGSAVASTCEKVKAPTTSDSD